MPARRRSILPLAVMLCLGLAGTAGAGGSSATTVSGRLTAEPYAWHEDRLRYVWRQAQREIAAPFVPIVEQVLRAVSVLSPDGHNSRDTGSTEEPR